MLPELSTLFTANASQAKALTAVYQTLLDGVPNIGGYTALIEGNVTSNFGAGEGTTFNDENIFINIANSLIAGNATATAKFATLSAGSTLKNQVEALYNSLIPVAAQTDAGREFMTRPDALAFYTAAAAERGITSAEGPAIIAFASILKVTVDEDLGVGNAVNDLIAAVKDGSAVLPDSGDVFTPIEDADGTKFDGDDAPSGTSTVLTKGVDSLVGTAGDDTFLASDIGADQTFTVGDSIDGGTGDGDVLKITAAAAVTGVPAGATVTGVENVEILSGAAVTFDTSSGFSGLTSLKSTSVTGATITAAATTDVSVTGSTATGATAVNGGKDVSVTETGANGGTVNIGATTAAAGKVTVDSTILSTGGSVGNGITVKGGTEISVTQKGSNAVNTTVTDGGVDIDGDANTTTVTVTNDKAATAAATVVGHVNGAVAIDDKNAASATDAGTIATVTVKNAGATTVNSGALTTLNLMGTITSVNADTLGALTTAANNTLALNVDGLTVGGAAGVDIDDDITTVNIASANNSSTISDFQADGAKTVNVSGDAMFTATANTEFSALESIVVTNTAGASFGTALGTGVTFTGGAGADSVSLGATTKAITMGAGDDTVTSAGLVGTGGSVDAGDGTGDTIVMTTAQAAVADNDATFNSKFTNFEVLKVSDALTAGNTLNMAGINGIQNVVLALGGANATTSVISGLASGATITTQAASTGFAADVTNAAFSATDVLNLVLENSTGGTVGFGTATAANIETVNITTKDTGTDANTVATVDTATLVATSATNIVVTGNNGLNLTNAGNVKVTTFDASGVVGDATEDTSALLGVTFVSANNTAADDVSITGGAGDDTLTGVANKDTIIGGAGDDTITGGTGIDTLTGGDGRDTFTVADGDAGITGAEKITDFALGTSGDTLNLAVTTLVADQTDTDVTGSIGGAVDVKATVKDGIITIGGADAGLVDTLGEFKVVFEALDADNTAENAAFVFGGNTYVITDTASGGGADTASDIIQLTGVTTATALVTAAAADGLLIA